MSPTFSGGTVDGNILPTQTGKDLGSAAQRWDAFLQDLDVSGTLTLGSATLLTAALRGLPNQASVITANGQYNAFPSIIKLANGSLYLVYRKATAHDSVKGTIVYKTSTDLGRTWSSETTLFSHATLDVRDPNIVQLSNGTIVLSYFTQDPLNLNDNDNFVIKSTDNGVTWGSPIAVTGAFANWEAVSAPAIQLANGNLLLAVYGEATLGVGESVKVYRSTDNGDTWSVLATVMNGPVDLVRYTEPNLLQLPNGTILCLARDVSAQAIAWLSTSADNGATWTAPANKFTGLASSPHLIRVSTSGSILTVYRTGLLAGVRRLGARISLDSGTTWSAYGIGEVFLELDPTATNSDYASQVEIGAGLVLSVNAAIQSASVSNIRSLFLSEGWNLPPLTNITAYGIHSLGLIRTEGDIDFVGSLRLSGAGLAGTDGAGGVNWAGGLTGPQNFYTNGASRWVISAANPGSLLASSDGGPDIGAAAGNRPRDIFITGTYTGSKFISTVATGTAPLTVASTTTVPNLTTERLAIVNNYNGIATFSGGIPAEYATVDLTAQGAAITTTTLYAVPATGAGQYRVSWNAKVTTAATTGAATSTLGALTIVYTDPDAVVQTITMPASVAAGAITTSSADNTTATVLLGMPILLNCKLSTNITYAMAYASNTAAEMKFNLHIKCEAM